MGVRVSEIDNIAGLEQWEHSPAIEEKSNGAWGVYCQPCSDRTQDYVKCEHLSHIPDELVAKEPK